MTDKDKARYAELEAKEYLVDDEDVIDYYRLRCEKLEEENKKLIKVIKGLKGTVISKKRIQSLRETDNPLYEVVIRIPQNILFKVIE